MLILFLFIFFSVLISPALSSPFYVLHFWRNAHKIKNKNLVFLFPNYSNQIKEASPQKVSFRFPQRESALISMVFSWGPECRPHNGSLNYVFCLPSPYFWISRLCLIHQCVMAAWLFFCDSSRSTIFTSASIRSISVDILLVCSANNPILEEKHLWIERGCLVNVSLSRRISVYYYFLHLLYRHITDTS